MVISGNRRSFRYTSYRLYRFDGILHAHYTPEELSRIVMMSDDLRYYTVGIPGGSPTRRWRAEKSRQPSHACTCRCGSGCAGLPFACIS